MYTFVLFCRALALAVAAATSAFAQNLDQNGAFDGRHRWLDSCRRRANGSFGMDRGSIHLASEKSQSSATQCVSAEGGQAFVATAQVTGHCPGARLYAIWADQDDCSDFRSFPANVAISKLSDQWELLTVAVPARDDAYKIFVELLNIGGCSGGYFFDDVTLEFDAIYRRRFRRYVRRRKSPALMAKTCCPLGVLLMSLTSSAVVDKFGPHSRRGTIDDIPTSRALHRRLRELVRSRRCAGRKSYPESVFRRPADRLAIHPRLDQVSWTSSVDYPVAGSHAPGRWCSTARTDAVARVPVRAGSATRLDYSRACACNSHCTGQRLYIFWTDASCVAGERVRQRGVHARRQMGSGHALAHPPSGTSWAIVVADNAGGVCKSPAFVDDVVFMPETIFADGFELPALL